MYSGRIATISCLVSNVLHYTDSHSSPLLAEWRLQSERETRSWRPKREQGFKTHVGSSRPDEFRQVRVLSADNNPWPRRADGEVDHCRNSFTKASREEGVQRCKTARSAALGANPSRRSPPTQSAPKRLYREEISRRSKPQRFLMSNPNNMSRQAFADRRHQSRCSLKQSERKVARGPAGQPIVQ
jgi:hypothetical protein